MVVDEVGVGEAECERGDEDDEGEGEDAPPSRLSRRRRLLSVLFLSALWGIRETGPGPLDLPHDSATPSTIRYWCNRGRCGSRGSGSAAAMWDVPKSGARSGGRRTGRAGRRRPSETPGPRGCISGGCRRSASSRRCALTLAYVAGRHQLQQVLVDGADATVACFYFSPCLARANFTLKRLKQMSWLSQYTLLFGRDGVD